MATVAIVAIVVTAIIIVVTVVVTAVKAVDVLITAHKEQPLQLNNLKPNKQSI